jgi:hypothetical protein
MSYNQGAQHFLTTLSSTFLEKRKKTEAFTPLLEDTI